MDQNNVLDVDGNYLYVSLMRRQLEGLFFCSLIARRMDLKSKYWTPLLSHVRFFLDRQINWTFLSFTNLTYLFYSFLIKKREWKFIISSLYVCMANTILLALISTDGALSIRITDLIVDWI